MRRAVSLSALIVLAGCAESIVFQPPITYAPDTPRLPKPNLQPALRGQIAGRTGPIETWYWDMTAVSPSPTTSAPAHREPDAYVLMSSGNAMIAQQAGVWIRALYAGRNVGVLAWNYPGYGSTPGPRSFRNTLNDALIVFDHLRKQAGHRPIILHGISIGSCPSVYIASKREVTAVVLEGPPRLAELMMSPQWGWWNLWLLSSCFALQVPSDFDPAVTAHSVDPHCPLVVIHGDRDNVVPLACGREVFEAWPCPTKELVILPDIGHAGEPINRSPEAYRTAIDRLFERSRLPQRAPVIPPQ